MSNHGKEQFLNEVKLIRSLQHRNLVRIIGCCVEGEDDSMFLVYEYVSNQSLDKHLFGNAIFIVYYFYMILSKYKLILFPFLSFFLWVSCFHSLLLGFIFLMISTSITMWSFAWWTPLCWSQCMCIFLGYLFILFHWQHFDSDILMYALY